MLIPLLDKEVLRSEVASLALSKGDVDESVNSRVICARILGAMSGWMVGDQVVARSDSIRAGWMVGDKAVAWSANWDGMDYSDPE